MPVDEIYMNNTKTLAIVAVLTAATLVLGVTFAAAPSAFAAKRDNGKGDGNTVTEQENKQKGIQSGWDNIFEQDATNLICTHPESPCIDGEPTLAGTNPTVGANSTTGGG
jgi:hypothetical protein